MNNLAIDPNRDGGRGATCTPWCPCFRKGSQYGIGFCLKITKGVVIDQPCIPVTYLVNKLLRPIDWIQFEHRSGPSGRVAIIFGLVMSLIPSVTIMFLVTWLLGPRR
jgi:hypothetical protein